MYKKEVTVGSVIQELPCCSVNSFDGNNIKNKYMYVILFTCTDT